MPPRFFATPADFRQWLDSNHGKCTELWVGYHKTKTGRPSITWAESVDEALCFGWIDGIRKPVDESSYTIRFTPRVGRLESERKEDSPGRERRRFSQGPRNAGIEERDFRDRR
jgi:uncharacterized protein YdeI (YjbR/CyaY-like superfamily)